MATSNYLSRDACTMFKIIPKGFPHAEVNVLKASDKTPKSEERVEINPKSDKKDENMSEKIFEDDKNILKLVEEFYEIFKDKKLEPMNTEPMEIKLRENYVPKALTVPRKVPYARRDDEIKEIRKLEAEGIIEPVGDRPTEFCSPTICPVKPDGTIRFTTDFTYLSKQVLRTSTVKTLFSTIFRCRLPNFFSRGWGVLPLLGAEGP